MDRMLVVVFDNEEKAYQGQRELRKLEREGEIYLYGTGVIAKNENGVVHVREDDDDGILGGLVGTSLGTVIGLLGGPIGVAIGATAGLTMGAAVDLDRTVIGEDFIDDVRDRLLPGMAAVVADLEEDWTTPVDVAMEDLGGIVFRRSLSDVRHTIHQEEVAAMKADLVQLKAERAQARADRKVKINDKINQLESKIQARLQKSKERRETAELQAQYKANALRAKAEVARAKVS
jgi:uncharacterized membrane protein